jgi:RNA polymerase sigma-70 factor (ECF subfamily)
MIKPIYASARKGDFSNPFGVALYNTVSKTISRMAGKFYSILSDEDVNDLIHDTYLRLLENQQKADLSLNFDGWVFRTCKNMVNSCAKAKSKRNSWIVDLDEDYDDDDAPFDLDRSSVLVDRTYLADRETLREEFKGKFWKVINRLSPESRNVIELLMEETPYKEMAHVLGCSEGALRVKVFNARKALKKLNLVA